MICCLKGEVRVLLTDVWGNPGLIFPPQCDLIMATMVKSSEAMAGPDLCSGTCLCGVIILYKQFYCQLTAKKKIEIKVPNPHCIKRLLQIVHISSYRTVS